jgi:hypothetical protein
MNNASVEYSGGSGRLENVRVYRTPTGKFVVAIHHHTIWQGEHDTDEAAVFPSLRESIAYLQERVPGWMLQDLISALGEEAVAEEVE